MSDELKPQSVGDDPEFRELMSMYLWSCGSASAGKAADALIAHINAWRVPAGYRLLPVKSTAEMNIRGRRALRNCGNDQASIHDAELCWSAMIEAAPDMEPPCGS